MRAVIFGETSTESTGLMVPVAETVERRSLRTTSAVSMALACFAVCWDW